MSKVTLLTTTFILSCVSIALVQAEVTVIEGGTLINGTGSEPVRDAVVIIDGNQIRATGRRGQVSYPAGAQVIDAAGKFIVPGLIESHIHYRHWLPEILLSYGTTSIFDICNETEWILAQKEGIAKGKIFGPRIFAVGPLLNGPPNMQIYSRFQIDEIILESREHARQVVRELVAKGVDAIKVYANTTVELLKAVADEAHKAGLPVLGHLKINARDAARAGIDNLVHGGGAGDCDP